MILFEKKLSSQSAPRWSVNKNIMTQPDVCVINCRGCPFMFNGVSFQFTVPKTNIFFPKKNCYRDMFAL